MKATVRRFHSPDVNVDTYTPEDPTRVGLLIQAMVGPENGPGEEAFDVVVCTPSWLERLTNDTGPVIGRHHLIVDKWDASCIKAFLTEAIEAEEGSDWADLAAKIGRIGKWEFEDYRF